MVTPVEREAIVQKLRREMLEALVVVEQENKLSPKELAAFRELCKDYESPGSLQLQALESRIQALENSAAVAVALEGNTRDGTIKMGP